MRKAWYSKKADEKFGHCIYEDESGNQVKITEVCDENVDPVGRWDDLIYIGKVVKCIKSNILGMHPNMSIPELMLYLCESTNNKMLFNHIFEPKEHEVDSNAPSVKELNQMFKIDPDDSLLKN